jgi:hypothetical protein
MDLAIRAKGKRNFFEVQNLAGHNGLRSVDLRYTPLHREVIEQLDRINTMCVRMTLGMVWKGRECRINCTLSLTTRIRRSMKGLCLFVLVRFSQGTPINRLVNCLREANSPSPVMKVTQKPCWR